MSFSSKVKDELRANEIRLSSDAEYLKGEFLRRGSVTNPEKAYHLEFVAHYPELCDKLTKIIVNSGIDCKLTERKNSYIVYIKGHEQIADLLTFIGAPLASMHIMNIKIEKEFRNDLNRTVNAESANLEKTISAAVRILSDIQKIERKIGLETLPPELYEVAKLRKKFKDISIAELGKKLNPPLTKSGTQNRLRKISGIAEKL